MFLKENHQKVVKGKKLVTERSKSMDKYAKMKRFIISCQLQVYMYAFIYVDPETINEEDYFPATKILL